MESSTTRKVVEYLFQLACVAGTIGTTSWCLYLFWQNNDVCLVDFKQYNEEIEYISPSFSLAFLNPFVEEKFKKYGEGIDSTSYIQFLEGRYWDDRMLNISYDDVTIDIHEYFLGYEIRFANMTTKKLKDFDQGDVDGWKPPYISLRHPKMKAFGVDSPYQKGTAVVKTSLNIKTDIFPGGIRPNDCYFNESNPNFGGLLFMLHYPGQMYRSWALGIGKWAWPKRTNTSSKSFEMSFTRRNMDVLVRRNKRNKPCNEDWENYDSKLFETRMRLFKCRPPYYYLADVPVCSTIEAMRMVGPLTPDELNNHDPPCRSISKLQFDYQDIDDDGKMTTHENISYFSVSTTAYDSTFKLIELVRAYDITSLIGNAGGYLGIFLGYALCQLPIAITNLWKSASKAYQTFAHKHPRKNKTKGQQISNQKIIVKPCTQEEDITRNTSIYDDIKCLKDEIKTLRRLMQNIIPKMKTFYEGEEYELKRIELEF